MASQKIPRLLNTICLSFVLTVWLVSVNMVQAAYEKFEACAPRSCGIGPDISYPFWVATEQESYCGYPTFQVSCDDGRAVLAISNDNYIIREILYGNNSLILSNAALYEVSCPVPQHNFSTQRTLFNYSENQVDFYLYYDCPSKPDAFLTFPIACASNSSHYSFGVFNRDALEETGYALNSCKATVNSPVDMAGSSSLVNSGNMSYTDILKTGFALNWTSNYCSACANSGGRCGFDNNDFICFCRDGPQHKTCRKGGRAAQLTIVIVVSTLSFVALLIGICIIIIFKRRKVKLGGEGLHILLSSDGHDIKSFESLQYDFETIRVATDNFKSDNKLGQGGFGSVYKGKLIDGKEIAVKRLAYHSGQGDREFTNEVVILAKLQHRNLVRLLGYCLEGNERLLIYEFVPNSSLDHFLFDDLKRVHLDWETSYKIISGIAKGLLYLHEDSRLRIIHRDLKAGNILLDEEMCPKIADFGMARLFILNQTQGDTSRIVGTYGYMAPEYGMHGKFSVKSDVYSFGVLLLEIISGQKNSRFCMDDMPQGLPSFAWENWKAGKAQNIIDPSILNGHINDILRCIHIGLLCVQDSVYARPTMATVALMLSSASQYLPLPSEPAYFSSIEPEMTIRETEGCEVGTFTVNQVSFSDKLPR